MNAVERKVAMLAGTHLAGAARNNPLVRLTVRYWPVTILVGTALAVRLWNRHKDKDLTLYTALTDTASIVTPWGTVALLSEFAMRQEQRKAQVPAQQPYGPAEAANVNALLPPTAPV